MANHNNIHHSFAYESEMQPVADRIYEILKYKKMGRCTWTTPGGKENQQADRDILVRKRDLTSIYISEKFRSSIHDDCLIELISDWEKGKPGSIKVCTADVLAYIQYNDLHHALRAVMIDVPSLQHFLQNTPLWTLSPDWNNAELRSPGKRYGHKKIAGFDILSWPTTILGEERWRNIVTIIPFDVLALEGVQGTVHEFIIPKNFSPCRNLQDIKLSNSRSLLDFVMQESSSKESMYESAGL